MFKSIYIRLAFTNLKKNKRSYLPFLVTSIITIMLFFDMSIIMDNSGIKEMPGAGSMRSILGFWYSHCCNLRVCISFLHKQLPDQAEEKRDRPL